MNSMQLIKRRMYAMRNGIVADALRKGGSPFRYIFGVNLPQLVEIAAEFGPDANLAEDLWADTLCREAMLIAPMVMPREGFTIDDARRWIATIPCAEVSDILCHRLLRHLPFATVLASELSDSPQRMQRYTAIRLMLNLRYQHPDLARQTAQKELAKPDAIAIASSLLEE